MTNDRGGQPSEPTSYGLRPPQPPTGPVPQQGGPYASGYYQPTQDGSGGTGAEGAAGGASGGPHGQGQGVTGQPGAPAAPAVPPNPPGAVPQAGGAQQSGRVLGDRYELTSRLGHGGMGTVWLARDRVVKREVAVKEPRLPDHLTTAERQTAYQRMQREAQAAARIDHPSVVTMHDVVVEDGKPWVVMELVRGQSLADRLQEGTLDPREAARIGLSVAGALKAAHDAGVLHRDVKPDNVLLGRDGRVVLTDFGIAQVEGEQRLTETGAFVGSPEFISPERVLGQHPGPAADLWSLGVVLYAAVEGMSPFRRSHTPATLQAVLSSEPQTPARAAGPLATLIMQLLRKDPMARPTAAEVRITLESVAHAALAPTQVYAGGQAPAGNRWVPPVFQGNRPAQYGLGAGVIVVALALVLLLLDPFGGGGLPEKWEVHPEREAVKADIAVPEDYERVEDDGGGGVSFYDPSGVFDVYLQRVDNAERDASLGDTVIKPTGAAWEKYWEDGGDDGIETKNEHAVSEETDYKGHKAYDVYVSYQDYSADDEDDFRYVKHDLIIPKGDGSKVYWRLDVRMPAKGWAHGPGEELYHNIVDHLEIEGF